MIADIVLQIGTPEYGAALFHRMRSWLSVRQLTVYRFTERRAVQSLLAFSQGEEQMLQHAQRRYISQFHRNDPLHPQLLPPGASGIFVRRVSARDITDTSFREELYGRAHIAGKLVFTVRTPEECLSLSLFRGEEHGPFTEADMAAVEPWSESIVATLVRHLELTSKPERELPGLIAVVTALPATSALSEREVAVCARVLRGMTIDGIAVDLGVSNHSAITYRRRAYAKLGVHSVNQLFALALGERQRPC